MNEPEWSEEDWERDRKARRILHRRLTWERAKLFIKKNIFILVIVLVVLFFVLKNSPW